MVTCAACRETTAEPSATQTMRPVLDRGQPGASVVREYQRRKSNREARTRKAHPRIGGLLLALRSTPQHESAFHLGELGEQAVAASLEQRTAHGPAIILNDRRMPGGRGNIDHLAIAANGVFVIDAKNIKGKVRVAKPLFGAAKLRIAGRNRTKLIDGLDRQVVGCENSIGHGLRRRWSTRGRGHRAGRVCGSRRPAASGRRVLTDEAWEARGRAHGAACDALLTGAQSTLHRRKRSMTRRFWPTRWPTARKSPLQGGSRPSPEIADLQAFCQ
jgi:hypothetical protein